MKKFYHAFDELMKWEGVASDHPADPGGKTIYGIARNYWKQAFDEVYGLYKRNQNKDALAAAKRFYRVNFWNEYFSGINYTPLGYKLFDLGVNMGTKRVTKMLQRILNYNETYFGQWWNKQKPGRLKVDGSYGTKTHVALTTFDQQRVYKLLINRAEKYYRSRNHFWKFGRGWLRRLKNVKRLRVNVKKINWCLE